MFENFRNKYTEIYELGPTHFFICTWISMASMSKRKTEKRLKTLTDIDKLLMVKN